MSATVANSSPVSGQGSAGAAGAAALQHRRLTDAAQQFEGMLLQELLKPMKEHGFCQEDRDDNGEDNNGGDTLSGFATESVAAAIARGGGLGIARRVVSQVEGEKAVRDGANGTKS